MIKDYDAIGFDMDFCLVRYNVQELLPLLIKSFLSDLHENFDDYKTVRFIEDFKYDHHLSMFANNCVWDLERGTILKLSEGREITHAALGYEFLSKKKIIEFYGEPPVYRHLD